MSLNGQKTQIDKGLLTRNYKSKQLSFIMNSLVSSAACRMYCISIVLQANPQPRLNFVIPELYNGQSCCSEMFISAW